MPAALLILTAAPVLLLAQTPAGPEFRVSTYVGGEQGFPAVASDPSGKFLVVWKGDQPGGFRGVFGQRYDSSGTPLGAQFRVSTYTTFHQGGPAVAADAPGNYVVVWVGAVASTTSIFARRYDATGLPLGSELTLRDGLTVSQFARVASDADGNFVVVWVMPDGHGTGVFGRRYDAAGVPRGAEFQVNSYTTSLQGTPAASSGAPSATPRRACGCRSGGRHCWRSPSGHCLASVAEALRTPSTVMSASAS